MDPTLTAFHARCQNHDWHYSYSDDGAVYRRGAEAATKLRGDAKRLGGQHQLIYEAWADFKANKGPEPQPPEEKD